MTKGGLILERFSLWSFPYKLSQSLYPHFFHPSGKVEDSDFVHFLREQPK